MIDFNAFDERTEITIDDVNWLLDKFFPRNKIDYEYTTDGYIHASMLLFGLTSSALRLDFSMPDDLDPDIDYDPWDENGRPVVTAAMIPTLTRVYPYSVVKTYYLSKEAANSGNYNILKEEKIENV